MTEEEATVLAQEHWNWLVRLLERIYKDAMIHGYKHGYEDREKEVRE